MLSVKFSLDTIDNFLLQMHHLYHQTYGNLIKTLKLDINHPKQFSYPGKRRVAYKYV